MPVNPVNLKDVPNCVRYAFFDACIENRIFGIINDLRSDLELGTSYKIDAIKLAWHFLDLKLKTIDWTKYAIVTEEDVRLANSVDEAAVHVSDPTAKEGFVNLLNTIVTETVDAALVMTVIPACEALEDVEAIERNKNRFSSYKRCTDELNRMKQAF